MIKADTSNSTKVELLNSFDQVLGLNLLAPIEEKEGEGVDEELRAYVEEMIAKRAEAKTAKDFATADKIRDELAAAGFEVKDTKDGVTWKLLK